MKSTPERGTDTAQQSVDGGTAVTSADDVVPYECVAYATERPDGLLNLFKFLGRAKLDLAKFMPEGEEAKQKEGTNVSYGTATLKGTYSPRISDHVDCYKRLAVDPDADSALITEWFAQANYYKPASGGSGG